MTDNLVEETTITDYNDRRNSAIVCFKTFCEHAVASRDDDESNPWAKIKNFSWNKFADYARVFAYAILMDEITEDHLDEKMSLYTVDGSEDTEYFITIDSVIDKWNDVCRSMVENQPYDGRNTLLGSPYNHKWDTYFNNFKIKTTKGMWSTDYIDKIYPSSNTASLIALNNRIYTVGKDLKR